MSGQPTWTLDDGRVIALLRPEQLADIEPGTMLLSIMGKRAIVGTDPIDGDTRAGYIAYGAIVVDRTYEERITKLAEDVVRAAPPLLVRTLSTDGEGALAGAMRRLIDAVGNEPGLIRCLGCEQEIPRTEVDEHAPVDPPGPGQVDDTMTLIPGGHSMPDHHWECPGGGSFCDRNCPVQTPCGPLVEVKL